MIVKLLSEHHLEFLSLKDGCRGSFESTLAKMSNCWKSHVTAHYYCNDKIGLFTSVNHYTMASIVFQHSLGSMVLFCKGFTF